MYRVECAPTYEMYAEDKILQHELIYTAELFLVDRADKTTWQEMSLRFYAYAFRDDEDTVILSPCILMPHSLTEHNVSFQLVQKDGKTVMEYRARRDIEKDEPLFVNYHI
uniref:SET domain-containing protein n=1 Tax=viral metagenome TaxID=1070528 RepID=A0A6C0IC30_9ZZZZ